MQIGLFQTARMEQRLVQSPQMIQAMQILQLSAVDLQERIEQELLENPLLEVKDAQEEDPEENPSARREAPGADPQATLEALLNGRERGEWVSGRRQRTGSADAGDRKHEAMQNTPATYHSLGESLLQQIALIDLDDRRRQMVEFLVYSLDSRGYLRQPLSSIAEECSIEGATEDEIFSLLQDLRHATHPALGASDLRECLLLQVDRIEGTPSLLRKLIEEHLGDIAANRLPRIALATGRSIEEIGQAIEVIRTLDPTPGRDYGQFPAETIHPDVIVQEMDGTFEVRLTREGIPDLAISAAYRKLLREAARGDSVRKWIMQRLGSARWFIDALKQRQSTLLRIARAIFERQRPFLEEGLKALQPLRMLEVADATGVHISTVSRGVAGKYAQTPQGILSLRSFFSGGTLKDSGGFASQASIQLRMKELVKEEDPSAPLSDDRLAELLKERDGIRLARRTITKYRKALTMSSSSQRRVF